MKKELLKYLFRSGNHTYAVLDGASVPDLPVRLYEMNALNICLYRGDLEPDIAYVAPYLVYLQPGTAFTDWLLAECWGLHWGIFAQSPFSLTTIRKHFRLLLTVYDETGRPLLFRYYDPRVLSPFLLSCGREELEALFGKIKYYYAESDDRSNLFRFHLTENRLNQTQLKLDLDSGGME